MKRLARRRAGRIGFVAAAVACITLVVSSGAPAQPAGDTEVTVGSNDSIFPQNKQNEPEVAVNPLDPSIVAAGSNDEIDLEACNVEADNTCPFTTGVGVSGVYFSFDGGSSWTQPTYTGWTARDCLGVSGTSTDMCAAHEGPIGTLPNYFENGLVADGDPALAFGPRPGANGGFSWSNGVRLYYANLTSNFSSERSEEAIKGFEAIAVSRTDDVTSAAAGSNDAWMDPVIVSRQSSALFADHEAITVDDAASSRFFGNVYSCFAAFRSVGGPPEPIKVARSSDGGDTWKETQVSPAVNNAVIGGRQDCQLDTDSRGTVYVFFDAIDNRTKRFANFVARSFDGGRTFDRPRIIAFVDQTGIFDPNTGRLSWDGLGGARDGSAPLADVANGAPTGAGATDVIYVVWEDGPTPSDTSPGPNEEALVTFSTDRGATWATPVNAAPASDRPLYTAIAVNPTGTDLWLTYDAFFAPWQHTTANPRLMQGVVRHADVTAGGAPGAWSDLHRGATGDARGSSQNNLAAEFLGDYNAVESKSDGAATAVWNDVRSAADCPAIDAFRQVFSTDEDAEPPAPNVECPPTFGNSDIFGGTYLAP